MGYEKGVTSAVDEYNIWFCTIMGRVQYEDTHTRIISCPIRIALRTMVWCEHNLDIIPGMI